MRASTIRRHTYPLALGNARRRFLTAASPLIKTQSRAEILRGCPRRMRWKKFLRWQFAEVCEAAKPISAMYSRFVLATHSA
jgi:hypothetical protein